MILKNNLFDRNIILKKAKRVNHEGFEQIKGIPNSYLAIDDIEMGIEKKIPLWLFGFLY